MISLSYSRISLADIAQKLQLDSPEDAEFIVAKVPAQGVPSIPVGSRGAHTPYPAPFPHTPSLQHRWVWVEAPAGKTGATQGTMSPLCVSPGGHPMPFPVPGLTGHPGWRHRGQHQP